MKSIVAAIIILIYPSLVFSKGLNDFVTIAETSKVSESIVKEGKKIKKIKKKNKKKKLNLLIRKKIPK